jgi:peptidoglycan/LPS O-acetylase OafA/YrhL
MSDTLSNLHPHSVRIYGLDILRSMAILFVVYYHGYVLISNIGSEDLLVNWVPDGVTIFFVLSGFLIGGIFIRTLQQPFFSFKSLLNFWIKRWFRTLPNYYLVLIIITAIYFSLHHT